MVLSPQAVMAETVVMPEVAAARYPVPVALEA
jgi:hypothetical protein